MSKLNEFSWSNIKLLKEKKIFRKNDKNKEKYFACFAGKMEAKIKLFYTKMVRKKALSAVKISSNLKKFAGWTWRLLVDTPIYNLLGKIMTTG